MNDTIAKFFGFVSFEQTGNCDFLVRTKDNTAILITTKPSKTYIDYYIDDELIGTVFKD